MNKYFIQTTKSQKDYELLDSGEAEKLERFGNIVLRRPDPQSLWEKTLDKNRWGKADLYYRQEGRNGKWEGDESLLSQQNIISFNGLKFKIKLGSFKHTGIFPEQASNWRWIEDVISKANRPLNVINLFGYTGAASIAAAHAGANVCHVDGSKVAINWGKENQELSDLGNKPIRWICDDVIKFLQREVKRGHFYDGIVMDPPSFGHGPNNELWKIEKSFFDLMTLCRRILSKDPVFVLINGYAAGYSPIAYANNLNFLQKEFSGLIEMGELTIEQTSNGQLLPCGIFARWSK